MWFYVGPRGFIGSCSYISGLLERRFKVTEFNCFLIGVSNLNIVCITNSAIWTSTHQLKYLDPIHCAPTVVHSSHGEISYIYIYTCIMRKNNLAAFTPRAETGKSIIQRHLHQFTIQKMLPTRNTLNLHWWCKVQMLTKNKNRKGNATFTKHHLMTEYTF